MLLNTLNIIGVLDENENLTVLGNYLTLLPVEPKLGKMLILGAIFNCLDPILTVVSGLSVRDLFLSPFDKKDLVEAAKAQFSQNFSDHLAFVRVYEGWKVADNDHTGHEYCWKNFLSAQSMKAIDSLRTEFYTLLKDTGLVGSNPATYNVWSYVSISFAQLFVMACILMFALSCTIKILLCENNGRWAGPFVLSVSDSMLLLFGGSISKGDTEGHLKMLGGYLEFFTDPANAKLYLSLREQLDELIQMKLLNPGMDIHSYHELMSAIRLLISQDKCDGKFVFNHQPSKQPVAAITTE